MTPRYILDTKTNSAITFRKSAKILFLKLAASFLISSTIITLLLSSINLGKIQNIIGSAYAFDLDLFSLFIAVGVELYLFAFIMADWINTHYYLDKKVVKRITGLFGLNEYSYLIKDLGHIEVHQGIAGKIFGFGSLYLYFVREPNPVAITEIDHPEDVERYINQALTEGKNK